MIKVEGLQKRYGDILVLDGIDLTVQSGEVFGIVGHSGAGKSTFLRCLNGLESYQAGSVKVMGQEVKGLPESGILNLRREMGMVFQNFNLMSRKNVFDNIAFPLDVWGAKPKEKEDRVLELLDLVGLSDKRMERVGNLSGGQKQRIGIARALALNPKILLCDEATSALDPKTTVSILELLEDVNRRLNITIILVTHQMEVVKRMCHRMLLLDKGRPQGLGKTDDLFLAPKGGIKALVDEEYALIDSGTNIRISFPKEFSLDCFITRMARALDINFSIVGGKLERYLDVVHGFLVINVDDEHLEKVLNHLQDTGLYWEVLND